MRNVIKVIYCKHKVQFTLVGCFNGQTVTYDLVNLDDKK